MRARRGVLLTLCFVALAAIPATALAAVTYQYDQLGRLIRVEHSNGSAIIYDYDPAGNRTQKIVSVNNQPPVAGDDSISVTAGLAHDFDPLGNDSDPEGGALAITAKTDGAKGTVTILSGTQLRYTANAGTSGSDSFTYTIEDPEGASDTATVSVMISSAGFTQTIQITGASPVNLRALADAAGYDGAQDATITFEVGSGVTIMGAAPDGIGIDTGTWPTGTHNIDLTLVVKTDGKVYGGGGAGGNGGTSQSPTGQPGGNGGDAIHSRLNMSITVETGGEIKAGGGGGSGGSYGAVTTPRGTDWRDGGGGGGGFPNGPGGAGTMPGADGSVSGGGAGGTFGAAGGDGGNAGQDGESTGNIGGAAGYAIRKNDHTISIVNNGTMVGLVQ